MEIALLLLPPAMASLPLVAVLETDHHLASNGCLASKPFSTLLTDQATGRLISRTHTDFTERNSDLVERLREHKH